MAKIYNYSAALTFAFQQPTVQKAIEKREKNGFSPLGVNMRTFYNKTHKKWFVQVNLDYYRQNQNENYREDIIVWLTYDNTNYFLYNVKAVHEVDDGLD
jgi:hypothetical protein